MMSRTHQQIQEPGVIEAGRSDLERPGFMAPPTNSNCGAQQGIIF